MPAQARPVPVNSPDGAVIPISAPPPRLEWLPGDCNVMFRLEFSPKPDFKEPVVLLPATWLTQPFFEPPPAAWEPVKRWASAGSVDVYWRVIAFDDTGRTTRSEPSRVLLVR